MKADADPVSSSYSYNVFWLYFDASLPLFYGFPNFRHKTSGNVAYVDGHVGSVSGDQYSNQSLGVYLSTGYLGFWEAR